MTYQSPKALSKKVNKTLWIVAGFWQDLAHGNDKRSLRLHGEYL